MTVAGRLWSTSGLAACTRLQSLTLDLSINHTDTARNHDPFEQLRGLLQPLHVSETLQEIAFQTTIAIRDYSDLDGFRAVDRLLARIEPLKQVRLTFQVMVCPSDLEAFKEAHIYLPCHAMVSSS